MAVLLALYVDVSHKAPGQGKEGEQTLVGGQVDWHQVQGANQTFAQDETTAQ